MFLISRLHHDLEAAITDSAKARSARNDRRVTARGNRAIRLCFALDQLAVLSASQNYWATATDPSDLHRLQLLHGVQTRATPPIGSLRAVLATLLFQYPKPPPMFSCCKFAAPPKRTSHEAWTWRPDRPIRNRYRSAGLSVAGGEGARPRWTL